MENLISFSSSPLTKIINAKYYDFENTILAMERLWNLSNIQGFELQHLAEWQNDFPPRDNDPRYDRRKSWEDSKKYTVNEITERINKTGISILSVHGNRDIGILCCSNNSEDIKKAKRLIIETCEIAQIVSAKTSVFHIWDTFDEKFHISRQKDLLQQITKKFPKIQLSVENIPTKLDNYSPYDLVEKFKWITLDLRWAAIYDELRKFAKIKDKIVNIHIRGTLEGAEWNLKGAPFTIDEALDIIINHWNYKGLFTIEPESGLEGASWEDLIEAIDSINKIINA